MRKAVFRNCEACWLDSFLRVYSLSSGDKRREILDSKAANYCTSSCGENCIVGLKTLVALIIFSAFILSSCDEEESSVNLPPDLKMEDIVGCWYWKGEQACNLTCFDPSHISYYVWYDSVTPKQSEQYGVFSLDASIIRDSAIDDGRHAPMQPGTLVSKTKYRRVGDDLYSVDDGNILGMQFFPVNLDSVIPCGKPFSGIVKPAGWTLF